MLNSSNGNFLDKISFNFIEDWKLSTEELLLFSNSLTNKELLVSIVFLNISSEAGATENPKQTDWNGPIFLVILPWLSSLKKKNSPFSSVSQFWIWHIVSKLISSPTRGFKSNKKLDSWSLKLIAKIPVSSSVWRAKAKTPGWFCPLLFMALKYFIFPFLKHICLFLIFL